MKKLAKILFAVGALFATACEADKAEYALPVDVSWTTYLSNDGCDIYFEDRINVEPGDYIFIRDVSQSVISREWTIDDKVSFFTDSQDTSTTIEDKTLSTSDAYILFEKSGVTTIKLRLTFPEKVATYNEESIEAVYDEELDVWVFEKEWSIEIYGELKPGFSVNKIALDGTVSEVLAVSGDEETSLDELTDVYVSQGDILEFVYDNDSEYKSTSQSWTVPGGTTDGSGGTSYTFNSTGTYSGYYITAIRDAVDSSATSDKISKASVRKVIPMQVIVEYAAISPLLGSITQQWDSSVEIPFNKALEFAPGYTPEDLASAFSFKVSDIEATITSAAVSEEDSNVLVLTVTSELDNYKKTATLSYNPTTESQYIYDGSISNSVELTDPAVGFTDITVSLYDIFDPYYFGFDGTPTSSSSGSNIVDDWWLNCTSTSKTLDGSYIDVKSIGDNTTLALYYEMYNGDISDRTKPLVYYNVTNTAGDTIAAGDYTLHWNIYVEEYMAVDPDQETAAYVKVVTGGGSYTLGNLDISTLETGKWLEVTTTTTVSENSMKALQITFDKATVTNFQQTKFYLDDLYLSKGVAATENN